MVPTMLICQQQQSNKGTRRSIEFSQAEEVQVKQVNPRTRAQHFKSKLKNTSFYIRSALMKKKDSLTGP